MQTLSTFLCIFLSNFIFAYSKVNSVSNQDKEKIYKEIEFENRLYSYKAKVAEAKRVIDRYNPYEEIMSWEEFSLGGLVNLLWRFP